MGPAARGAGMLCVPSGRQPPVVGLPQAAPAVLDVLVARATGTASVPFWDGWRRLRQAYDRRLPA